MRKQFALILFLAITSVICEAQVDRRVKINPKFGINFTDLLISGLEDSKTLSTMGWNIGADVRIGSNWQGRTGLHYYRMGSAVEMQRDSVLVEERITAGQLKVPLGVAAKVFSVDYFKLWVVSQATINFTTKVQEDSGELAKERNPTTSVGGRLGLGMDIGKVTLEMMYERSFTDVVSRVVDARNQILSVTLGLRF